MCMKKEIKDTTRNVEIINKISFLIREKDELYKYHPDNPYKIDVKKQYGKILEEIDKLENQLQ